MRFYRDDPRTCRVRWFFVSPRSPFVSFANSFVSSNWDSDPKGLDGIGEVSAEPHPWSHGRPPAVFQEGIFCGTREQWSQGQPLPPAIPTPVDADGVPLCCQPFRARVGAGGQVEGGAAVAGLVVTELGAGGQVEGGAAQQTLLVAGAGGQVEGGAAQQTLQVTGAGGQVEGGGAQLFALLDATGGQRQGGGAAVGLVVTLLGTGGQRQGGVAQQQQGLMVEFAVTWQTQQQPEPTGPWPGVRPARARQAESGNDSP